VWNAWGNEKCIQNCISKPERKRSLGPKLRWEDNIKLCLKVISYEGVDWIHVAQDRVTLQCLVNMINETSGSLKYWEFLSNYQLLKMNSSPWV